MKSTLVCLLLAGVGAVLLLGDAVDAWNRQFFNRYPRSWLRNNAEGAGGAGGGVGGGGGGGAAGVGGSASHTGNTRQVDDFNALFGLGNDVGLHGTTGVGIGAGGGTNAVSSDGGGTGVGFSAFGAGYDVDTGGFGGQQQTEIYGIVEPLIEDTPCVDRACQVNDDCCPTGVCVSTYGEGKCIYVYGRKRDLCHRNTDCELGMSCLKTAAGNLLCQPSASAIHLLNSVAVGGGERTGTGTGVGVGVGGVGNNAVGFNVGANIATAPKLALSVKQFGEDCVSSSDCNVNKGLCCQLQRNHHRIRPRKLCNYFRDPFMCIDIMPTEDEEVRESRFLSAFSQRRM